VWIRENIVGKFLEFGGVTYDAIKTFRLPDGTLSGDLALLLVRGVRFPTVEDRAQGCWRKGLYQDMDMIGHDHKRTQRVVSPVKVVEGGNDNLPCMGIAENTLTASRVQLTIYPIEPVGIV